MKDVHEAVERITARFAPRRGLEDLSSRRRRVRMRRRAVAGAIAVTLATGGTLLALKALPRGAPGPAPGSTILIATWPATTLASVSASASASPSPTTGAPQECPTPSGQDVAWALSSTSGPAGSSLDVSGTFQSGQFWIELWWNADGEQIADAVGPPPWPPTGPDLQVSPAGPGPVTELVSAAGPASGGACSFNEGFTVPDVAPGTYQLVFVLGASSEPPGNGGYAVFQSAPGSVIFEVTP
jgi:hypothetical protein